MVMICYAHCPLYSLPKLSTEAISAKNTVNFFMSLTKQPWREEHLNYSMASLIGTLVFGRDPWSSMVGWTLCYLLLHFQVCLQVWGLHTCSVPAPGNMTSQQSCINQSFVRHAQEPVLCSIALQPVPQQQNSHFEFPFLSHSLLKPEAFPHSSVANYSTVLFWKLHNYGFP